MHGYEDTMRALKSRSICDPDSEIFQHMDEFLTYELCHMEPDEAERNEVLQMFRSYLYEIKGKECPMAKRISQLLGKKQTCQVHVWDRKKGRSRQCRNGTKKGHFCATHSGSGRKKKKTHRPCEATKKFNGRTANKDRRYCKWNDEKKGYYTSSSEEDSDSE